MNVEDLILVSVDDHIVEPPSLEGYLREHVEAKYRDRVPRVIRRSDGTDAWLIEGREVATFGLNAVQGRPPEDWGRDPGNFDEVRPGTYDVHERVRDMNANGVLASLNFPSWPGLGGQFFVVSEDKDYAAAIVRAYNDWHLEEWCGAYPGRFIPLALSGFALGPEWVAGEVRRMADKGCHAVSFHPEAHRFGMPDLHGDEWDPAWKACEDTGSVMVFHFGGAPHFMPRAPVDVISLGLPFQTAIFAADLLYAKALQRFPNVRLALAEAGIGWIPAFLQRADWLHAHHGAWTGADFGGMLPSELFRARVQFCFINDDVGLQTRYTMGVENLAWECDYPHSDSDWPHSPDLAMASFEKLEIPDDEINQITWQNACRWYQFDPFEHRPREACTVGALRAQAIDVDTTPRFYGSEQHGHDLKRGASEFIGGSLGLAERSLKA